MANFKLLPYCPECDKPVTGGGVFDPEARWIYCCPMCGMRRPPIDGLKGGWPLASFRRQWFRWQKRKESTNG
jgi:hypothetical protein